MIAVHDKDGLTLTAGGSVDQSAPVPRVLHKAANRRGFRTDHRNQTVGGNQIAETDAYKAQLPLPSLLLSGQILNLFPNLFQFRLHFKDQIGHRDIVGFRADRVDLPIDLLQDEVKLLADTAVRGQRLAKLN